MKQITFIKLTTIVVDESSPWRNIAQYERDYEDFLAAHGMEATSVNVLGNSTELVVMASKLQDPPPLNAKPMTFKQATSVKGVK